MDRDTIVATLLFIVVGSGWFLAGFITGYGWQPAPQEPAEPTYHCELVKGGE